LTGCYHLGNGHRLYSPGQMRYLSPDLLSPFGKGGFNAYAYCAADPVNHIDPSGKFLAALGSIAASRATTIAAYAGLNLAAWITRAQNPAGVWGLRQLAVETLLVTTGVGILFTGSPRLQPVGLGLVTAGNVTSIAKSAITIGRTLANGFREAASAVGDNVRSVFGTQREQTQTTSSTSSPDPSLPIPTVSGPTHHVLIDMSRDNVRIEMSTTVSDLRGSGSSSPDLSQTTHL